MSPEEEAAASAQFHGGLVMGAMSTHGCTFEEASGGRKVVLIGATRSGRPLTVTIEVQP